MFDAEHSLQQSEVAHTDLVACDLCGTPHHRHTLTTVISAVVAGEAMGEVLACPDCHRQLLADDIALEATYGDLAADDDE